MTMKLCSLGLLSLALLGCAPRSDTTSDIILTDGGAASPAATTATPVEPASMDAQAAVEAATAAAEAAIGEGQAPIIAPPGLITRPDFVILVTGRSKADIREAFGPPNSVTNFGGTDTWFYHADRLTITDPDAGVVFNSIGVSFSADGVVTKVLS